MPAHSVYGDDRGGIDGPRHAHSLRVGCGAVNPATARDCAGWAAVSCVSVANLQRVRSPAHREGAESVARNQGRRARSSEGDRQVVRSAHVCRQRDTRQPFDTPLTTDHPSLADQLKGNGSSRNANRSRWLPRLSCARAFRLPALLYYAPLAVGIRAMPMVVERLSSCASSNRSHMQTFIYWFNNVVIARGPSAHRA